MALKEKSKSLDKPNLTAYMQLAISIFLMETLLIIPLIFNYRILEGFCNVKWFFLQGIALFSALTFFTLKNAKISELFFNFSFKSLFCKLSSFLKTNLLALPLFLFFLWSIVSLFKAPNPYAGLSWLSKLCSLLIFLIALQIFLKKTQAPGKLYICSLVSGLIAALIGISQYFDLGPFQLLSDQYGEKMAPATLGHPNFAAEYLVALLFLTFPVVVIRSKIRSSRPSRILRVALTSLGLALITFYLLLSFSRAAWIAFIIGSIIFALVIFRFRSGTHKDSSLKEHPSGLFNNKKPCFSKRTFLWISIALFLILLLFFLCLNLKDAKGLNVFQKFISAANLSDAPVGFRIRIWSITLKMMQHNWFSGVGTGNYTIALPPYRTIEERFYTGYRIVPDHPHNEFLELASELGAIGLFIFLWLILSIAKIIRQKRSLSYNKIWIFAGAVAAFSALLTNGFFSFSLHNPASALIFWIALGLINQINQPQRKCVISSVENNKLVEQRTIQKFEYALSIIWTLLAIYGGLLITKPLLCDYYRLAGQTAHERNAYQVAVNYFKKAVKYNPFSFDAWHRLATACYKVGDLECAKTANLQAIRFQPYSFVAQYNLGKAYFDLNQNQEALNHFQIASDLHPEDANALNNLGSTYTRLDLYDEALQAFNQATLQDANNFEAYFNRALLFIKQNHYPEAIGEGLQIFARCQTTPCQKQSWVYLNDLQNLLQIHAREHKSVLDLATSYSKCGLYQESLKYFYEAKDALSKTTDPEIHKLLINALGSVELSKEICSELKNILINKDLPPEIKSQYHSLCPSEIDS